MAGSKKYNNLDWMNGSVDEVMDGWMDGWMDGLVDGWIDWWMDGWIDDWIKEVLQSPWLDGSGDGWMGGWVGWMDGLDRWMAWIIIITSCRRRFAPRHLGSVFCALFGNGAV